VKSGCSWAVQLLLSLLLGMGMALLIASACLMANLGRGTLPSDTWFQDGRLPWLVAQNRGLGTWWVNAMRSSAPLLGEAPEDFRPPAWAFELWGPVADLPANSRMAALAGGFPLPAIGRGWITTDVREIFPPAADMDLTGSIMDMGRDRFGSGGWSAIRLLPAGLALDAAPWTAVSLWLMRRWSRVSRQEAAAPPTAPAR
jgi:hypothetical protein